MLFHSQVFILAFLPVALAGYYLFGRSALWRERFLVLTSLTFYSYWDIRFLPLIVGSVCANMLFAQAIRRYKVPHAFWLSIVFNLGLIGYFKYRDFFASNLYELLQLPYQHQTLVLPIGISFFTFQQISYLVDLQRGSAPIYPFRHYALYVTFFPQLIAGPIVRHDELMFQLAESPLRSGLYERMARGMCLFVVGLLKKMIADHFAGIADPVFGAAAGSVTLHDAWSGVLAFTFQIYFDFSAYSDMAIGLGLMFGFWLPLNFDSPYKSASMREFWRRWHMTFSRFLRDYLYIPLGGNRFGYLRQTFAHMVTMLLCGLWHGAGWTFVLWGGMHGVGLIANNTWRRLSLPMHAAVGWVLTMVLVVAGWVLFRSVDLTSAWAMFGSLVGYAPHAETVLGALRYRNFALAAAIVLFSPNSQQLVLERMQPRSWVAVGFAIALVAVFLELGNNDNIEFIYFEF